MEPESVARRYYDLVDAGEYEELVTLFSEDVVYERPGQTEIEGRAALKRFYEEGRPLSNGEHELHNVVVDSEKRSSAGNRTQSDDCDTVAVRGTFRGTQAGEPVEIGFADFHEFEDGKINRRFTFTDRDTV
jgi:ketosteroid isomerase-like protein